MYVIQIYLNMNIFIKKNNYFLMTYFFDVSTTSSQFGIAPFKNYTTFHS